jgi:hypothetical protein
MKKKPTKKLPKIEINFREQVKMGVLSSLQPDPKNPRKITAKDYDELKQNIIDNPDMLWTKPIMYQRTKKGNFVKVGNQRFRCCIDLGLKEAPLLDITGMTEKQIKNLMLWDNHNSGSWDNDALQGWTDLPGWLVPNKKDPARYNDSNAVMPIVPVFDEKHRAVLIVIDNNTDFINLCGKLNMGKNQDYKTQRQGQTQVISFKDFEAAWKKR